MAYHVYILKCADGSYYVGQTENLQQRLAKHQSGTASQYTSTRLPVSLVYSESLPTRTAALARENQLKRWSRAKKEALIQNDLKALRQLSKNGGPPYS